MADNQAPQVPQKKTNKLVVIGLDGGTYDVIDPLIAAGRLPNLARLIKNGVRGRLLSTIPPVTGPAWTSFMTGKDPGGHGLFDFVKPAADGYSREIVNYTHIRSRTIWSILSDAGFKVGVVGVPVTYPPPEVNGFVVSGMLTPSVDSNFTYPAELAGEIKERFGDYFLDIWWQHYNPGQEDDLLDALHSCARQRWQVSLHLMQSRPCDVFMTVFVVTDRIHHSLWHLLRPEGELDERGKRLQDRIHAIYDEIDTGIGKIIEAAGEDTNFLLMSDHGFGPLKGKFSINTWLQELGLLQTRGMRRTVGRTREKIGANLKWLVRRLDPLGLRKKLKSLVFRGRMRAYSFLNYVDWERTRAYSASNTEQGIYINLAGREPKGFVQPGSEADELRDFIVAKLKEIRHPETGEQLVNRIFLKDEIYHGPFVSKAPDIVFFLKNGEYLADVQLQPALFTPITWKTGSGTHRLEGFFAGCGPDIKKGLELEQPRIIDLAPTILGLLGQPIPSDVEGRVLEEMLTGEFLKDREFVRVEVDEADAPGPSQEFTRAESEKVEEQLKDLGYL
jgi:predicted AlkP superfamily phosphohydrolase/phosphomutase